LACVVLLLHEVNNKRSKRNRIRVHERLLKQKTEGEFSTLYRKLRQRNEILYMFQNVNPKIYHFTFKNTVRSYKIKYNLQKGCNTKIKARFLSQGC
jgi:hypothetical protein